MNAPTMLAIDLLRRDGGTQPRDHLSMTVAQEYAEAMADGDVFPPVTAFFDGTTYWLADGFHRVEAHLLIGAAAIAVDVRQGALRDAILYSVGANASHGYRRSNADKRRAVQTLLADPDWAAWSDREIARRCAVGHSMVSAMRPKPSLSAADSEATRTYTTRHGSESTMRVGAIGRVTTPSPVECERGAVTATVSTATTVETLAPDQPAQHDWSQGVALLDVADVMDQIATLPDVATILAQLRADPGSFPSLDTILAAGAWMDEFVTGYPEVHAARQARANELQESLRHVAQ